LYRSEDSARQTSAYLEVMILMIISKGADMLYSIKKPYFYRFSLALILGIFLISGLWFEMRSHEIRGLVIEDIEKYKSNIDNIIEEKSPPTKVYLRKAIGNLEVIGMSTTDTYEVYFHIPVPFNEQIPILIEVESPELIDYRFLHLNPPNVIIAARMNQAPSAPLNWTAWVFVRENTYSDLPSFVPLPSLEQLPDSVKKWLVATDCAQINDVLVQQTADSICDTTTNLMKLADDICDFCQQIPGQLPHYPYAFDAVYTLKWGNSCTGHAHAGAALFRANGIPARTLLNIPTWFGFCDMHWIIDYYVPAYGWVRMETVLGQNPCLPETEVVTFACNPEDEFPMFFPCAIDGCWHTSDPVFGMWQPDWGGAHRAYNILTIPGSTEEIEYAHSLTDSVFNYYSNYFGINLTLAQQSLLETALDYQASALVNIQAGNLGGYIEDMQQALNNYKNIDPAPITTIFFDDFESGQNGWTHGGDQDEWELGVPTYGPTQTHSGENCWGVDLDNTYENYADCWLLSPPIDLNNYTCAYLSFWVWNWVEDVYGYVYDPLWIEITTDGMTFYPLCSKMGGVNDDPEIPDVGGWSMVALDLTKYVDNTVQIRFHFNSDGHDVQAGSYIDDVHVYGRYGTTGIITHDEQIPTKTISLNNMPNPFSRLTSINYGLNMDSRVVLKVYSCTGQLITTLVNDDQKCGMHNIPWDGYNSKGEKVSSGIYFLNMEVFSQDGKTKEITKKIIKIN